MGIFDRLRRDGSSSDDDLVRAMARYGQARWTGAYDPFDPGPFDARLQSMSRGDQESWVAQLAREVVPHGGWAVYGAEETVMRALRHPVDLPAYREILDGALAFQREGGVWESQLSANERSYWSQTHPGERWALPQVPPAEHDAQLTPLGETEVRQVTQKGRAPESRGIYASRRGDVYVSFVDEVDAPRGDQGEYLHTQLSLYALYASIGALHPVPPEWIHPEAAAFLAFPMPRI